jgi:hypothetical protein
MAVPHMATPDAPTVHVSPAGQPQTPSVPQGRVHAREPPKSLHRPPWQSASAPHAWPNPRRAGMHSEAAPQATGVQEYPAGHHPETVQSMRHMFTSNSSPHDPDWHCPSE